MSTPATPLAIRQRRLVAEADRRFRALVARALQRHPAKSPEGLDRRLDDIRDDPLSRSALDIGYGNFGAIVDEWRHVEAVVQRSQADVPEWPARWRQIVDAAIGDVRAAIATVPAGPGYAEALRAAAGGLASHLAPALAPFEFTASRCFVVSDVHLGVAAADEASFKELLSICERGDTLVLLGDILDFWIHDVGDDALAREVTSQWRRLHVQLTRLREQGVKIVYVPGNHDGFVFTFEAYGHLDWCASVLNRAPTLRAVQQQVAELRLATVGEIRYPFLRLRIGKATFLLTHGHVHEDRWRFISGEPTDSPGLTTFLAAGAAGYAHRFARELRAIFNLKEAAYDWVRHAMDVAVRITNRHVDAYAQAMAGKPPLRSLDGKRAFLDSLEHEFQRILGNPDDREIQAIRDERAFDTLADWQLQPVAAVRREVEAHIAAHPREPNFQLWSGAESRTFLSRTTLRSLGDFDDFVCGHFHKPRDQGPDHDSGGLLEPGPATCLQINPDGQVLRPVGIGD